MSILTRGLRPWQSLAACDGWDTFVTHIHNRIDECVNKARIAIRDQSLSEAAGYDRAALELEQLLKTIATNIRKEREEERHDRTQQGPSVASVHTA